MVGSPTGGRDECRNDAPALSAQEANAQEVARCPLYGIVRGVFPQFRHKIGDAHAIGMLGENEREDKEAHRLIVLRHLGGKVLTPRPGLIVHGS
jgi:hypothetical protein